MTAQQEFCFRAFKETMRVEEVDCGGPSPEQPHSQPEALGETTAPNTSSEVRYQEANMGSLW